MNRFIIFFIFAPFLINSNVYAQDSVSRTLGFLDSLNNLNDPVNWGEGMEYISNVEKLSEIAIEEDSFGIYELCRKSIHVKFIELEDYEGLSNAFSVSEEFAKDTLNSSVYYRAFMLSTKTTLYRMTGDFKAALDLRLESINLIKDIDEIESELITQYSNLVVDYNLLGDVVKSREYCYRALDILQCELLDIVNYAIFYQIIGKLDYREFDYSNAILNFNRASEIIERNLNDSYLMKRQYIDNLLWSAECYVQLNEFEKAKILIEKADSLQMITCFRIYRTFEVKAQYYSILGDENQSIFNIQESIRSATEIPMLSTEYAVLPRMYYNLADYHKRCNEFSNGLEAIQRGLSYFSDSLVLDVNFNPPIIDIQDTEIALKIMILKTELCNNLYNDTQLESDYQSATKAYNSTLDLLSSMRTSFLKDESKFYVLEKAIPIYNSYLDMVFDHYLLSNDSKDKELIYDIIGITKSAILIDKINYKKLVNVSDVPIELVESERELRMKKTLYTKLVKKMEQKDTIDTQALSELKDNLFNLNQDYDIVDKRIREANSDVGQFYRGNDLKAEELMSNLEDDEMVIDFYCSNNYIYTLALFNGEIIVNRVRLTEVKSSIDEFVDFVSNPPSMVDEGKDIVKLSEGIVSTLLKPFIDNQNDVNKLRILPSGLLNSLPFEALSYVRDGKETFLINDCSILYSVSRSQLLEKKEIEENFNVLAVSPKFDCQTTSDTRCSCNGAALPNLKYAQEETEFINSIFNDHEVDSSGSSAYFLNSVSDNSICHLATHGCVNASDPMLSEIFFSDGAVTGYDILNLDTDISLMVLSACNTAKGDNVKGEGVISLTRGFFEAGVKNMISSLWAIDDLSSSQIVKGLYRNLDEGHTYSEAFRSSKLEYLESSDKLRSHPYYWAGLIQIGAGVSVEQSNSSWMYLLGVGVLFFLFLWIKRRK